MKILDVKNLSIYTNNKKIVNNLSFSLKKGECLGILGESGSGKSMTCKAIMGLLDSHRFKIDGEAIYLNENLLDKNKEDMRQIRGKDIAMILQNPMTCFDPLYNIGYQIEETLKEHIGINSKIRKSYAIEILKKMKIRDPEEVLSKFPHQLSGGMLQRIMIGLSLSMNPSIIIADEPTTAIDSITQFEIMKEFLYIKEKHDVALIFISHDIGVINKIADKVIVMNNGNSELSGDLNSLFNQKDESFTKNLIDKKMAVMNRYKEILKIGENNATRSKKY
ncbi:MAG: ABC transporter ATP-binding protein [Cetobacterium sp.]|uniref:ABC transporter ATP-binding protein n=1 Tax=Cetobacterium sp. ZWU0022 TaxID=1340502 RepID=UPI00064715C9|nr:ABC transporter ATP-binding protein [Cetobacterium sp. ZWU0022]